MNAAEATAETPSRAVFRYKRLIPDTITCHFPTKVILKRSNNPLVIGRSEDADIFLNDVHMSRSYAHFWHDDNDPFVFHIKNISERKLLMVGGKALRCGESYSVANQTLVQFDFIEFVIEIYPGDFKCSTYEVCVEKLDTGSCDLPSYVSTNKKHMPYDCSHIQQILATESVPIKTTGVDDGASAKGVVGTATGGFPSKPEACSSFEEASGTATRVFPSKHEAYSSFGNNLNKPENKQMSNKVYLPNLFSFAEDSDTENPEFNTQSSTDDSNENVKPRNPVENEDDATSPSPDDTEPKHIN